MRWRFVDRVLAWSGWQSIVTLKAGSLEEYSLLERWGCPGEVPAILMLESAVQSAAWLVAKSSGFNRTLELQEVSNWQGITLVPGERLYTRVEMYAEAQEAIRLRFAQQSIKTQAAVLPFEPLCALPSQQVGLMRARMVPLADREAVHSKEALWNELFRP